MIALLDPVMQEKVWTDLDAETQKDLGKRNCRPFNQVIYDAVIMQKGL